MSADVCRLAINLARNCGYAVFPCTDDKRPTLKGWPQRAATDAGAISELWRHHPGPLIGVVCGHRSGVSVLDIDRKHPQGVAWWQIHHSALLPTRTFRTRSGGLHLWMRHREGVHNTQGKVAPGVDTRGEGGYAVCWFAAGCPCIDHSPPAPWPAWLLADIAPKPAPELRASRQPSSGSAALDGILRLLCNAREGKRNGVLFWCACRLAERHMGPSDIEALLLPIAADIGLSDHEARATIRSATGRTAV